MKKICITALMIGVLSGCGNKSSKSSDDKKTTDDPVATDELIVTDDPVVIDDPVVTDDPPEDNTQPDIIESDTDEEENTVQPTYNGPKAGQVLFDMCTKQDKTKDDIFTISVIAKKENHDFRNESCSDLAIKFSNYNTFNLTSLDSISFNFNGSFDMSVFQEFRALYLITIASSAAHNFQKLSNLKKINMISIYSDKVELEGLLDLNEVEIEILTIDSKAVFNVEKLGSLQARSISLTNAKIESLENFRGNNHLMSLSIRKNSGNLNSLAPIANNTELIVLSITDNIDIEKNEENCPVNSSFDTSYGVTMFCKTHRGI